MSKELKYKVGDTVIVVAKIDRVDADDDAMSYREWAHGMWFGESAVIGKLPEEKAVTGENMTAPEPKFKVGDKVRSKRAFSSLGNGKVIRYSKWNEHDTQPYRVEFENGERWARENDLELVTEPETAPQPKYQVGDPVRHPNYGKGEVVGYMKLGSSDEKPYQVQFASKQGREWFSESELTPA